MPRPHKPRWVDAVPAYNYFKPQGVPMRFLDEVRLAVDELEALRLRFVEGLEHEQAAERMGVSRQTFGRILEAAGTKVASALVEGKALRVEGGHYAIASEAACCGGCGHRWAIREQMAQGGGSCPRCGVLTQPHAVREELAQGSSNRLRMENGTLKIAAVSDDGVTISRHFGRATMYVVSTVEDRKVVSKETRPKLGHSHFATQETAHAEADGPHGFDPQSQARHAGMAATIADCQVVLLGGAGYGAYESLREAGLEVIPTDIEDVDKAVQSYIEGTLESRSERLH